MFCRYRYQFSNRTERLKAGKRMAKVRNEKWWSAQALGREQHRAAFSRGKRVAGAPDDERRRVQNRRRTF